MDEAAMVARLNELRAMGLLTELDYAVHRARIRAEHEGRPTALPPEAPQQE